MSSSGIRVGRGSSPAVQRALLGAGLILAMAATVFALLTDEVRWLKIAVLLGVWAALIATIALARAARDVQTAERHAQASKQTYELELHREIIARREFEIGLAEAARKDADSQHREELAGVREQLDRLTTTLSHLLDGDLLFERLTLSAESTRVRQIGDGPVGHRHTELKIVDRQRADPLIPGDVRNQLATVPRSSRVGGAPQEAIQPGRAEPDATTEPAVATPAALEPTEVADVSGVIQATDPSGHDEPAHNGNGHFAGISVADLVAAYGSTTAPPRRRRRAQD